MRVAGRDHAGVVDHRVLDAGGGARRHHDARGGDRSGVRGAGRPVRRRPARRRHRIAQQAVALEVDREGGGAADHHRAAIGRDQPAVGCAGARQHRIALPAGADRALVGDRSAGAARETIIAGREIAVRDVRRRGDQPADIDARALAEQHAIAVDDPHLAVGEQAAIDRGRIGAQDAVERDRGGVRLAELHSLAGGDAEAVPVDDELVRRLADEGGSGAGIGDRRAAERDSAAGRLGPRRVEREHAEAAGSQEERSDDSGVCLVHRVCPART